MSTMMVQFDIQKKKITIDQAKSEMATEEDLLESAILASRLLVSLTEILSKSKDKTIVDKLVILKNNLQFVLDEIVEERDM